MASKYARYLRRPGGQPTFTLGAVRALLTEEEYRFSLFDADAAIGDDMRFRMVLSVPVAISAVSFSVAIALLEEDAQRVDAGDLSFVASLANAVQGGFPRFRTFPASEEMHRFVI